MLTLLPAERHPAKRLVEEVPEEGALAVQSLAEMGELVTSLTERAEAERQAQQLFEQQVRVEYAHAPRVPRALRTWAARRNRPMAK